MATASKVTVESPFLLAAWPGMGLVAFKTVEYLISHLPVELVEQGDNDDVSALRGIQIDGGVIQPVEIPGYRLYACSGAGDRDLLLYLGDEQPVSGKEWALASDVLDRSQRLGVQRVYTFAAMPTERIDHRADPGVWGCATDRFLLDELEKHEIEILREGSVTGLNGLLLGVARYRGIPGCCLLGEIPPFMTQMENPRSTGAIIERLGEMIGLSVDLSELRALARVTEAQIDMLLDQVQKRMQPDDDEEDDSGSGSGSGSGQMN